jgi:hypothetical protein
MDKATLEPVKVISPIVDLDIRTTLSASPIWKQAYTESELKEAAKLHSTLYEYSFKFAGLKVAQFTGVKKLSK